MFKVNNKNTRARCEICSQLTISVSIVNFELVNAGWVYQKFWEIFTRIKKASVIFK